MRTNSSCSPGERYGWTLWRALVGRRYAPGARHSVHAYLSPGEQAEFVRMTPEFLADQVNAFWAAHGRD